MTTRVLSGVLACSLLLSSAAPALAADSWIEVKSAHFTLLSSASEGSTRTLAWQLEQIRSAVVTLWPWARVDLGKPFQILVVKDENGMKALTPKYWEEKGGIRPASQWVEGVDQHYIAIRTDVRTTDRDTLNPYISAYFSYVASVLQASFDQRLPAWFQRGLAGVMSNTIVRDSFLLVGPIIPWELEKVRNEARLPLARLVTVTRGSRDLADSERLRAFDAQSWAFVHFLMFGEKGAHQKRLAQYGGLLQAGTDPTVAFAEAFGRAEDYEKRFLDHVRQSLLPYVKAEVDAGVKREAFPVRAVPAAESAATRAAFHVAMRRPNEARALVDEARKADPNFAGSDVVEGLLLDADGKRDEARAAFGKAVERGTSSAYAQYRFARMGWRSDESDPATLAAIEKSAARAIAINNRYAAAYAFLAEVRAALKQPPEAVAGLARRAIALEPWESRHYLAASRVFWRLEMHQDALKAAEAARSLAQDDYERGAADEMLKFIQDAKKPG